MTQHNSPLNLKFIWNGCVLALLYLGMYECEGRRIKPADMPKGLASSAAPKIAARLKSISGGKILDVATGDGDFIRTLIKTLKDYDSFIGIDSSKKEVESARKRLKEQPAEILDMNAEALQFENNAFDTVCMSYSLHHLENIDMVLAEMKRVLKRNGHFIIQEQFSDGKQTEAQKTSILQHYWDAKIDNLFGVYHHKTLTRKRIKDAVSKLRLRELEVLESTHSVKCLFCKSRFKCENPKDNQMVNQAVKGIDKSLKKLKKHPDLEAQSLLKEQGRKLKERIEKTGVSEPSHLYIFGKK